MHVQPDDAAWLVAGLAGSMGTPDTAREPRLERAMPADAVSGSTVQEDTEAEVLLQDGAWIWCRVIGQRQDRRGPQRP